MGKIGIITFHYSNNFGGVLQCYALYSYLKSRGLNVEVINYIPSSFKNDGVLRSTGLRKNIFESQKEDLNPLVLTKRIVVKILNNKKITKKFDMFRQNNLQLSRSVDENSITNILQGYDSIIVGSDQVWNPGRRNQKEYFLNFGELYTGAKISYAADSTISEIDMKHKEILELSLKNFEHISVRNEHSNKFVQELVGKSVPVVVDPTLLIDFDDFNNHVIDKNKKDEKYILVYALGKEINGTNRKLIEKIKEKYGDLKVYSVVIPTMKFNICNYADEVIYDLGPIEWINMFKNATFVLTDSFHGTLFSIKFRKPFLAYYAEKMRSTRFKDLGKRYEIDEFIVNNINEIDEKNSLSKIPDFDRIEQIINLNRKDSIKYLEKALKFHIDSND